PGAGGSVFVLRLRRLIRGSLEPRRWWRHGWSEREMLARLFLAASDLFDDHDRETGGCDRKTVRNHADYRRRLAGGATHGHAKVDVTGEIAGYPKSPPRRKERRRRFRKREGNRLRWAALFPDLLGCLVRHEQIHDRNKKASHCPGRRVRYLRSPIP